MVKIAVVGANSGISLEVIDVLVEGQKHEVIALARKDPSRFPQQAGVTWARTSYEDKDELVKLFQGVDVVVSFIVASNDPDSVVAKRVIDAAIEAGVPRYVPSEFAMGQKLNEVISVAPWYKGKLDVRAYLREINKEEKVIEYTCFQTGLVLEYIVYPRQLTKHLPTMPITWDAIAGRAVVIRGRENVPVTVTSVRDIAGVVRRAIEYEGAWPEIGGIQGQNLTTAEFKTIVDSVGALPEDKDELEIVFAEEEDIKKGVLNVYLPPIVHPTIPAEVRELWHAPAWVGLLSAQGSGAWAVTDEWNKLLPDYKFRTVKDIIKESQSTEAL